MASLEYDLDTSGGLMPQIQALIAPPVSDDASKARKREGKDLHPYYKRPGKGHNHDCCDACGEGGDLLCCDKCPASFHFQCHDPPLDEADLPIGEWLCHACCMAAAKNEEVEPGCMRGESRGKVRLARKDASEELGTPSEKRLKKDLGTSGMEMLVQAAAALNPRQFELPRELTVPLPFPGTDKHPGLTRPPPKRGPAAVKKKPYELDNGLVPLPVRTCFECRRSCRKAPLVACDYCPLLFHQDCLDPPLTSLPSGLWMCPNHPEQFLDSTVLSSCSASERVRLWDRYSGPIDQDAIKVEFIRKAHRQNPPFRFKVKLAPRNTVRVPDAVKMHYAQPPPLVPSLRTVLREEEALASAVAWRRTAATYGASQRVHQQLQPPHQEPLPRQRHRHVHVHLHEGDVKEEKAEPGDVEDEGGGDSGGSGLPNGHPALNGDVRWECGAGDAPPPSPPPSPPLRLREKTGSCAAAILQPRPGCPLTSVVRPTPAARHSPPATPPSPSPPPPPAPSSAPAHAPPPASAAPVPAPATRKTLAALASRLQALLDCAAPAPASPLEDEHLVRLLALQRIHQLLAAPEEPPRASASPPPPPAPPPPRVRVRALLCPLSGQGPPCPMSYRTLSVGTGADNDVVLVRYGHCNYVSPKHAAIFFDETTQHFELLNYSEHGTTVDNVLFSCDFSDKPSAAGAGAAVESGEALAAVVRAEVDRRRQRRRRDTPATNPATASPPPPQRMAPDSGKGASRCECRGGGGIVSGAGWEGTALLAHGSFLRFGCLQFVFSIMDHAPLCAAPQTS